MGALEHFLNVRVTRTRRFIQLDQSVYTQKVLDKFADFLGPPQKTKKSPLPSDASERIARVEGELSDDDRVYLDNFPYRSVLGALLYLSMNTSPDLALNPVYHKQSKHIEIKYHWVREHTDPDGEFRTATLLHVRTGDQIADVFTKALLTGTAFETHRRRMFGTERKISTEVAKDSERRRRQAKYTTGRFYYPFWFIPTCNW